MRQLSHAMNLAKGCAQWLLFTCLPHAPRRSPASLSYAGRPLCRRFSQLLQGSPPPQPKELRPYQKECIEEILAAFGSGTNRQAISLPVGSGKTVCTPLN